MRLVTTAVLLWQLLAPVTQAVKLWSAPAAIPTSVPATCRAVLVQDIACTYGNNSLVTAAQAANGLALVDSEATTYCTTGCYQSLKTFQTNVDARCGNTEYTLFLNSNYTQSAAALADGLSWAYNLTCIQDAQVISYLASVFQALRSCDAELRLWERKVEPRHFLLDGFIMWCRPGKLYLQLHLNNGRLNDHGDCNSISEANGVGTDLMINRNYLDYNCTVLTEGMSLCLQDTCTIHTLGSNETCDGILSGQSFSLIQLVSWNPTIHSNCDNLAAMEGRSICLSPPGGGTLDFNSSTSITPTSTLNASIVTSWVSATGTIPTTNFTTSWYSSEFDSTATATITATMDFNETLASELAQQTQYCWLTDEDMDYLDEEDYAAGCQSLMDEYCFPTAGAPVPPSPTRIPAVCTPDRSTYIPSTTTTTAAAATPTPYQPNMIANCQQFWKVISGDTCQGIADEFSITLTQVRYLVLQFQERYHF
ncbi:hypothetical protein PFICI_01995 [Pestalotiopsis fici W106-1]|uniref:LysM domain-containing protein n=1 Tax=Pestalotiopsis fici (strain W106-1 / CGMCC3.15140) TaxID=1229662 RepID=W3XRN3_PESFW|nr:uncharacterized protein PFICI_01995 [Pestalotiopsis fici W106-1]ETS88167.1 hypothetical protein PFICI_01995 [Pestalotiopsis fici W106-1]